MDVPIEMVIGITQAELTQRQTARFMSFVINSSLDYSSAISLRSDVYTYARRFGFYDIIDYDSVCQSLWTKHLKDLAKAKFREDVLLREVNKTFKVYLVTSKCGFKARTYNVNQARDIFRKQKFLREKVTLYTYLQGKLLSEIN